MDAGGQSQLSTVGPRVFRHAHVPKPADVFKKTYYCMEEVAHHDGLCGRPCWLAANGKVYDVTSFIDQHPAGATAIMRHAGQDCSEDFDFHGPAAQKLWKQYFIGRVEGHSNSRCWIM